MYPDVTSASSQAAGESGSSPKSSHQRRPRYRGKNPRSFHEKYKEHRPSDFPETISKVLGAGKTPAGSHRPILLPEILEVLAPRPGEFAVDCTLGYGGHAEAILARIAPGGHLLACDSDPIEGARTCERLRASGYAADVFTWERRNFAGLAALLATRRPGGADLVLADLGVSSMQLDRPERGFSVKLDGPLDMRMNPMRGRSAAEWLFQVPPDQLSRALAENADEPRAERLAALLAGRSFASTKALATAVAVAVPAADAEDTVRRVFQAIRIEVNDEFGSLDALLRVLPTSLAPGGRVAILTFHSGEDRRVKAAFRAGLRDGAYTQIADEVIRPGAAERRANPRATAAKLRWARCGPTVMAP
jgi:16S rRNA (cytosine1402-N4)-methyltransferase